MQFAYLYSFLKKGKWKKMNLKKKKRAYGLQKNLFSIIEHHYPQQQTLLKKTCSSNSYPGETSESLRKFTYLGVTISLYCSFSTRIEEAMLNGMTILLMS